MKLGCHVSNKGKEMLVGSAEEALRYGANCFMVYMGAPQNSFRKKVEDLQIEKMQQILIDNQIDIKDIIVHAPYIINLAQGDAQKRGFAVEFLAKELRLAAAAGFTVMVVHPGAHVGQGIQTGIDNIVLSLQEVLSKTADLDIKIALETMAGKGTEIGSTFAELAQIINSINDKRIVVCFDTCHTFDSGYDLVNDYEGVLTEFDNLIGFDKLAVIHVNDSKNTLGSRKDRHENIGFGEIGFASLKQIIYDERFEDIPKILETPYVPIEDTKDSLPPYKHEIAMIRRGVFNEDLKKEILSQ